MKHGSKAPEERAGLVVTWQVLQFWRDFINYIFALQMLSLLWTADPFPHPAHSHRQ